MTYKYLVEIEIIRFKLYYTILNDLNKILQNILKQKEIKHLLLRYILNRNISYKNFNKNIGDSLFIILKNDNHIADNQLKEDFKYFKINDIHLQKKIYNTINDGINNAFLSLKNISVENDNSINIINNQNLTYFEYESSSLNDINDDYIEIKNNKIIIPYYSHIPFKNYNIKYIFITLFRYKYIFIDAHSSALDYSELDKNSATECFSTPFNRHHNYYCSAFPDIEKPLGSLGNFFTTFKFPTKLLLINPPYDQILMKYSFLHTLEILKKYKHNVIFTLPDWKDVKEYNILYESQYFKKKIEFKKGDLFFTNYFTGKTYSPCANIQVYLSNIDL
jgi:hypothetical protein